MRYKTREIKVGSIKLGGNNPIRVQSMCNTDTRDAEATIAQIKELEAAGCELVRVAVPDFKAVRALPIIKSKINIPLVADIHYDFRLALASLPYVDKIRINPGTLGSRAKIALVVKAAKHRGIPIRVGINTGSLEKNVYRKYSNNVDRMIASVENSIRLLESFGFNNIVVALKSSDVLETIQAYRKFAAKYDYPLHLGLTEAGPGMTGAIRNSIAIGVLLSEGIGDTIRVSLTGNPVEEVNAAYDILNALALRKRGVILISCPTCSRCSVNLIEIVTRFKQLSSSIQTPIKVAIMGCEVNGPGEAKDADIGLAFSNKQGFLFRKGKIITKVSQEEALSKLMTEINNLVGSA